MNEGLQELLQKYEQAESNLLLKINDLRPQPQCLPEASLEHLYYIKSLLSANGNGGGDASGENQAAQIILETAIRDGVANLAERLPSVLANDRLKVDGSGATQPVSATSLPLPSNAATETMLQQVRDAITAQINFATTLFTDNSGAYYSRRESEIEGVYTTTYTDLSGNLVTPGVGLKPIAGANKDTLTDFYDVTTSGTGYSIGDLLVRVAILDANSSTPVAAFIWLNLTTGTILGSAPTQGNIERANENVGARQIGTWNFNLPTGAASQADVQAVRDRLSSTSITLINNATIAGTGSGVSLGNVLQNFAVQLQIISGTLTAISIDIQVSLRNGGWQTVAISSAIADGSLTFISNCPALFMRININTLTGISPIINYFVVGAI